MEAVLESHGCADAVGLHQSGLDVRHLLPRDADVQLESRVLASREGCSYPLRPRPLHVQLGLKLLQSALSLNLLLLNLLGFMTLLLQFLDLLLKPLPLLLHLLLQQLLLFCQLGLLLRHLIVQLLSGLADLLIRIHPVLPGELGHGVLPVDHHRLALLIEAPGGGHGVSLLLLALGVHKPEHEVMAQDDPRAVLQLDRILAVDQLLPVDPSHRLRAGRLDHHTCGIQGFQDGMYCSDAVAVQLDAYLLVVVFELLDFGGARGDQVYQAVVMCILTKVDKVADSIILPEARPFRKQCHHVLHAHAHVLKGLLQDLLGFICFLQFVFPGLHLTSNDGSDRLLLLHEIFLGAAHLLLEACGLRARLVPLRGDGLHVLHLLLQRFLRRRPGLLRCLQRLGQSGGAFFLKA
mmetsp:Transcript_5737/g.13468  ORF Transcript_5737/g.13468 Transcript_5737/m.13468 type:complete len:406 (+) Transcript_5737:1377-2594(+)